MATITQLQEQIFAKEGFRVSFIRLDAKTKEVPAYDFAVMASNKWRISDWKTERLRAYVASFRGVTVFRGDGTPVRSDMRLGNLRDTYFEATYGTPDDAPAPSNVTSMAKHRERRTAR